MYFRATMDSKSCWFLYFGCLLVVWSWRHIGSHCWISLGLCWPASYWTWLFDSVTYTCFLRRAHSRPRHWHWANWSSSIHLYLFAGFMNLSFNSSPASTGWCGWQQKQMSSWFLWGRPHSSRGLAAATWRCGCWSCLWIGVSGSWGAFGVHLDLMRVMNCLDGCHLVAVCWHRSWAGCSSWLCYLCSWPTSYSFWHSCCCNFGWFVDSLTASQHPSQWSLQRPFHFFDLRWLFEPSLSGRSWYHLCCSWCSYLFYISFTDSYLWLWCFMRLANADYLLAGHQELHLLHFGLHFLYFDPHLKSLSKVFADSAASLCSGFMLSTKYFALPVSGCRSYHLGSVASTSRMAPPSKWSLLDQAACCSFYAYLDLVAWTFASGLPRSYSLAANADSRM